MKTVVFILALVIGGSANAAGDAAATAKQHFDEGSKSFDLGDFNKAIAEYKLAYAAYPDPVFLYNIAQAARLNNDLSTALFFYRSFLRKQPLTPNHREVADRIRKLENQLAEQKALVTTPPNSTVPPGTSPGASPPEPATAPPPTSAPPPPTHDTASQAVTTSAPSTTVAAPAEKTPVYKKWWLWTAVGAVVIVGLGVGLGVGLSSGGAPPATHFGTTQAGF